MRTLCCSSFLKIALATWGLLYFHINVSISLSTSAGKKKISHATAKQIYTLSSFSYLMLDSEYTGHWQTYILFKLLCY